MDITKKKVLVLSSLVVFILIVGIVTLFYSDNDNVILESGKSNSVVRSNAITMMYETGYKTGEYQVTSDNAWPRTDAYTFNETLSKCENGSKIYWDSNTNRVMMEATTADKCYVYFEKLPSTAAERLQERIYAATPGDTIDMVEDVILEKTLDIDRSITLDGKEFTIITNYGVGNGIDVSTADSVILNNIDITTSGEVYAINAVSDNLSITDSEIKAVKRGLNYIPTNSNATLNISNTTIMNPEISNYDDDIIEYSPETRGISLGNISSSQINIDATNIYGYTIAFNNTGFFNDVGIFDSYSSEIHISNSMFKSLIAINNAASNIEYNFTNDYLYGIHHNIKSDWDNVATIADYIDTNSHTEEVKMNFYGGAVMTYSKQGTWNVGAIFLTNGSTSYSFIKYNDVPVYFLGSNDDTNGHGCYGTFIANVFGTNPPSSITGILNEDYVLSCLNMSGTFNRFFVSGKDI